MDIKTKTKIVAEAWMGTRGIEQWKSIHHYLDLSFPLAFAIDSGYVEATQATDNFITEAFAIIATSLGLDPDAEYDSFEAMLDLNIDNQEE